MSYHKLNTTMNQIKEELISAGFVEMIAPYFFLNIQPTMRVVARFQQLDQFAFLIGINEEVLQSIGEEEVRHILIQQMLHACRGAEGESLRWRVLIHQVNKVLGTRVFDREYRIEEFMGTELATTDYSDGYRLAQACRECGYKNMVPYAGQVFQHQIACPMCEQQTCCQAA